GAAVRAARCGVRRHQSHRDIRDDAARSGERALPGAPASALLRRGAHRPRPGRGLREAPRRAAGGNRTLAHAEPRLRAFGSERDVTQACIICRGAEADDELLRTEVWGDDLWRLTTSTAGEVAGFSY